MGNKVLGIDPGLSGAMALVNDQGASVTDLPTRDIKVSGKNRKELDGAKLASHIAALKPDIVYLERVASMPGQGVSSTFRFGQCFGTIRGVLEALGFEYTLVTPTQWKREFDLTGKEKDAARQLAIDIYPHLAGDLKRKKDCDRADALLIAQFGWL